MAISRHIMDQLSRIPSPEAVAAEKERAKLRQDFERVLASNFDRVPTGCQFESRLPGVKSLSILPKLEGGTSLQIILTQENGRGTTLSLTPAGELAGRLPRELERLSKEQILAEIIRDAEALKLDFWLTTSQEILPAGDWDRAGTEETGPAKKKENVSLSPDRLGHIEYLRKNPSAAFGLVSQGRGFMGYHVVVFTDGFAVLESAADENATYILDGLPMPPTDPKERQTFVARELGPLLDLSKQTHRKGGAPFFVHNNDASWRERVGAWIAKRQQPTT